jgi:tRNA-modifying protein YgfZ
MNYTLSSKPSSMWALPHYGSILVSGPDAAPYLQGQLSFDMTRLTPGRMELASCNSAQGRVQALLWMLERQDGIALVLSSALVDSTLARLRKYILRSKVKIESGLDKFAVCGAESSNEADERTHIQQGDVSIVRWPGGVRSLLLAPISMTSTSDESFVRRWHLEDIRAGVPYVSSQTHEAFVAQMLNVDLLGGISFEKGCYTGQEIIARTHFRGTVKRRMLRFQAECPAPSPGTRILNAGSHAGDVVDAEQTPNGCELLAVISLTQRDARLELETAPGVGLQELSLPYPVN